jgi:predicted membrane channel-forming protein YqfA (hemolysin III family)
MIGLIVWLVCVLLVIAALLGLVRAVLNLPPFNAFQPYTAVIYALIVLLCVLVLVSSIYGTGWEILAPPRLR